MTDYAYDDDDVRGFSVSDPVWRILTGAAAFAIGVFVCGSVGSYVATDPSWNAATDAAVQNLFGRSGAVFADLARQTLGWSAWTAGLALMIGGAMRTVLIGAPRIRRWVQGFLFVPLSAAFFAAWPVPQSWPLSAGLGGVIGDGLFHFAAMPFRALMLPSPEAWAGFVLGMFALWAGLSALGFRRSDARLLKEAATSSGVHAARQAHGVGRLLLGLARSLAPKRREEEEAVADVREERARVVLTDDDAPSFLRGRRKPEPQVEEDEEYEDEDYLDAEDDEDDYDDEEDYEDEADDEYESPSASRSSRSRRPRPSRNKLHRASPSQSSAAARPAACRPSTSWSFRRSGPTPSTRTHCWPRRPNSPTS